MSAYDIDDEMTDRLPQQHPQEFQQQRNTPSVEDLMTELIRSQRPLVKLPLPGSVTDDGRKKKLPDPERFDGDDRAKYPTFEIYLLAKFDVDRLVIGNEQTQVFYAFGRLTGKAAEKMRPWVTAYVDSPSFTVTGFIKQMRAPSLDPELASRA